MTNEQAKAGPGRRALSPTWRGPSIGLTREADEALQRLRGLLDVGQSEAVRWALHLADAAVGACPELLKDPAAASKLRLRSRSTKKKRSSRKTRKKG